MSNCHRIFTCLLFLSLVFTSATALAAPMEATISLGRDPEPPICVINSGGVIDITWNIEHTTTPNYVYYKLEDPTRTITYEEETYSGSTGISINRQWTVPAGAPDGKYWVRVEYWSFEAGNEANAEVTFYVCTDTGTLCAEKYEDFDGDGDCADDDMPLENWSICIETPIGDTYCKQTGPDGGLCWDGLPRGDYTIYEQLPSGWIPIGKSSYDVSVAGTTVSVQFCNTRTDGRGACCGPWGSVACIIAYGSWCVENDGIYMGDETVCGDGICATPTIPKTWGAVKALYR